MTTAERAEELAASADEGYPRSLMTDIAAALRELATIRRREEACVPSRPATTEEMERARDLYEHPSNADVSIPPDARAWVTSEEVRIGATVLIRTKR